MKFKLGDYRISYIFDGFSEYNFIGACIRNYRKHSAIHFAKKSLNFKLYSYPIFGLFV